MRVNGISEGHPAAPPWVAEPSAFDSDSRFNFCTCRGRSCTQEAFNYNSAVGLRDVFILVCL